MLGRTALGTIHISPGEQGIQPMAQLSLICQLDQQVPALVAHALLAEISQHTASIQAEALKARLIRRKPIRQMQCFFLSGTLCQLRPDRTDSENILFRYHV